jgi:hypothetical protein
LYNGTERESITYLKLLEKLAYVARWWCQTGGGEAGQPPMQLRFSTIPIADLHIYLKILTLTTYLTYLTSYRPKDRLY